MKILITFIIILLNITTSVFADKISFRGSGLSLELPEGFVKYDRQYLESNMDKILSQINEAGMTRTKEFVLNQMTSLEEKQGLNQFVNQNSMLNSVSFYLVDNRKSFTEEQIEKDREEIKRAAAEINGFGDNKVSTFEISTIFVSGKKGHRMIINYPGAPNYLMNDTWIEINDADMLRIIYSQPNTDLDTFVNFIEKVESTIIFAYENPFLPDCKMLGGTVISFSQCNYQIEAEDGTMVVGEANDGFITGLATVNYPSGETYRGTLVNGRTAGYGKVEFPNGNIIVGDFIDFFKKGISINENFKSVTKLAFPKANSGVVLKNDNRIYIGGLKDGNYHGEGILYVLKDDEKQKLKKDSFGIGIWENNKIKVNYRRDIDECKFDESGSIINEFCYSAAYYDDIVLVGVYEYDELKFGFQRFLTPSTEGLELGYFKNNVLNGYGFSSTDLTYTKYHFGEFIDGSANGYGVLAKQDFFHYGEFKDGDRDGFGYYEEDGRKIIGIYREREGNGYFEYEYEKGSFSASQVKNGERKGIGYMLNGTDYYYGEFKNDKADGFGISEIVGKYYLKGLFLENDLVKELEFCKKLFGDYYTNPKSEGCLGNDNVVEFREFIIDKNDGLGESWLEEYYKKERIKLD